MKRVFISVALSAAMVLAGTSAIAQTATGTQDTSGTTATSPDGVKGGYRHHGRHGSPLGMMTKKLNLTQAQQDQLKPMFEKQREQAKTVWQDNSLPQDQKKQKLQALHQDMQSQVNGVLTADQQQQWAQLKAQGKQHMAEARGRMGQRMAEKLNLSQQQQDQLKPIMDKNREQAKTIWQDNSLTQDQKKEKLKSLRQDSQTQMAAILTPDQQQQLQQMRQNGRRHHHGHDSTAPAPATEQPQAAAPQGM